MRGKLIELLIGLIQFGTDAVREAGGIGKLTFIGVLSRLVSARLWALIGGVVGMILWQQLGIPVEHVVDFWFTLGTMVGGFMAVNTITKYKEIVQSNVEQYVPDAVRKEVAKAVTPVNPI